MTAKPEELSYKLACQAYAHTSFTPEKRAASTQNEYAEDVNSLYAAMLSLCTNEAQRLLLEGEISRYKAGYLKRYGQYLHSHSRLASSMITGPANFPARQMQKRSEVADKRLRDFLQWRDTAQSAIKKTLLAARTDDEREDAAWTALRREIRHSLAVIEGIDERGDFWSRPAFVTSIVGKVERAALRGESGLVQNAAREVQTYNETHSKPAISAKSKFWTLATIAAKSLEARKEEAEDKDAEVLFEQNGILAQVNHPLDRVQLFFQEKPAEKARQALKSAGWHWSPREGAWQRKLTEAAKASARQILGVIKGED